MLSFFQRTAERISEFRNLRIKRYAQPYSPLKKLKCMQMLPKPLLLASYPPIESIAGLLGE
jgi:hypothetical protein